MGLVRGGVLKSGLAGSDGEPGREPRRWVGVSAGRGVGQHTSNTVCAIQHCICNVHVNV